MNNINLRFDHINIFIEKLFQEQRKGGFINLILKESW